MDMKRLLRTKRLYFLGDYRNIEFSDELECPEHLATNDEAVGLIKFMQLLSIEEAYRKYWKLWTQTLKGLEFKPDEAITIIQNLQTETIEKLKELFKNGDIENVRDQNE